MALIFAGYLLRAARRFERRADAIMARMDSVQAVELKNYDDLRDEVRASMRAKVDAAIAELKTLAPVFGNGYSLASPPPLPPSPQSQAGGRTFAVTPMPTVPSFIPDGWVPGPAAPRQTLQFGAGEGVGLTVETDGTLPGPT